MVSPIKPIIPGKADATTDTSKTTDQLRQEIQDRLSQIDATEKEQSSVLIDSDVAELDKMKSLLMGSLSLLDQYDKTGGIVPTGPVTDPTSGLTLDSTNLKVGWNGPGSEPQSDPNGVYAGIIQPENTSGQVDANGNPISSGLVFKMDDTMESVVGKNVGNDIEITVTYRADQNKDPETFLVKGLVGNTTQLMIAGDQTTQGITVNMSEVKRIGNKDPNKKDIVILGGSGDDTLVGSQGSDEIHGGAGNDTIYGLGATGVAGSQDVLLGEAGDDTIYGGAGKATLTGGAGFDTLNTAGSDNVATDPELGDTIQTKAFAAGNFVSSDGSWTAQPTSDGKELDVTNTGGTGSGDLKLTIPDGYLAYGKKDGDNLVLTLQHIGPDGIPDGQTEVVRIEGILSAKSSAHLTIVSNSAPGNPNMIDLGAINTQYNQVTLQKGQGNDVIVAPHTALDDLKSQGIKSSDFGQPTMNDADTGKVWDSMKSEFDSMLSEAQTSKDPDGFQGWAPDATYSSGVITLNPKTDQKTLNIPAPSLDGYTFTNSVAQPDKSGNGTIITCFMKSTDGTDTKRLVIHVVGKPETITVGGFEPANAAFAVQFLAAATNDTGGGTFVGSSGEIDGTGAGGNKVIEQN